MAARPLSIFTSGFEPVECHTVRNHRQVTPGDSLKEAPRSPPKWVKAALVRKQSGKGKEIAVTARAASTSLVTSENLSGT
ncbi:hypothetical protein VE02_10301, partial [Pseudogymnoascus sp. 03VT05]